MDGSGGCMLGTPTGSHPRFAVIQVADSLDLPGRTSRGMLLSVIGTVVLATGATAVGAGWRPNQPSPLRQKQRLGPWSPSWRACCP